MSRGRRRVRHTTTQAGPRCGNVIEAVAVPVPGHDTMGAPITHDGFGQREGCRTAPPGMDEILHDGPAGCLGGLACRRRHEQWLSASSRLAQWKRATKIPENRTRVAGPPPCAAVHSASIRKPRIHSPFADSHPACLPTTSAIPYSSCDSKGSWTSKGAAGWFVRSRAGKRWPSVRSASQLPARRTIVKSAPSIPVVEASISGSFASRPRMSMW